MRIFIWILIVLFAMLSYWHISNIEPKQQIILQKETKLLNIEMEKINALDYLNELREAIGLIPFESSDILENSASNHAHYLIANNLVSHYEVKTNSGYTGDSIAQRVQAVGYKASYVSENLSSGSRNYKESIDGLFSAIYHRFGFMDFKVDEIGIGIEQNQEKREKKVFVYNMGINTLNRLCNKKSFSNYGHSIQGACFDRDFKIEEKVLNQELRINHYLNSKIALYPYANQEDVPPAFFEEIPDPLPSHDVSGFPISISFDEERFKKLELISFRLFDSQHQELTNTLLYDHKSDINHMFKKYEFALFPLERLEWASKYFVEVNYKENGKLKTKKWSFTTRSFSDKIYRVADENQRFKVKKEVSAVFYFPPNSAHDLIKDITYPTYVNIDLIDHNTIRITLNEDAPSQLELSIGKHRLLLEVRE